METATIRRLIIAAAVAFLLVCIPYFIGRRHGLERAIINQTERVDTLFICDTITQYKPIIEERIVLQNVLVPVTDTLWKHDTLFVYLEREQVVWQDSLSKVYASGILPQIDSVRHYVSEKIVTRELTKVVKKPCRWGVGVHAGYGIQIGKEMSASPYVGIGLSYNIISW